MLNITVRKDLHLFSDKIYSFTEQDLKYVILICKEINSNDVNATTINKPDDCYIIAFYNHELF